MNNRTMNSLSSSLKYSTQTILKQLTKTIFIYYQNSHIQCYKHEMLQRIIIFKFHHYIIQYINKTCFFQNNGLNKTLSWHYKIMQIYNQLIIVLLYNQETLDKVVQPCYNGVEFYHQDALVMSIYLHTTLQINKMYTKTILIKYRYQTIYKQPNNYNFSKMCSYNKVGLTYLVFMKYNTKLFNNLHKM